MILHRRFNPSERGLLMTGLLRLADIGAVAVGGMAAFWLRDDLIDLPANYGLAIVLGMVGIANATQLAGMYEFRNLARIHGQFGRVTLIWGAVMVTLIVLAYLTKTSDNFSRLWAATWFVIVAAALIVNRVIVVGRIEKWRRDGKLARHAAIIGAGPNAMKLRTLIETDADADVVFAGIFNADDETGGLDDLLAAISEDKVDEVIIALDNTDKERLASIMARLGTVSVEVRLMPDTIGLPFPVLGMSYIKGAPLFDVYRKPLSAWSRVLKRIEDLMLSLILLVGLSPLMAVIALLIRLTSKGPALFRQRRLGFNNNAFTMYKFRTMYTDADGDMNGDGDGDTHELPQARRADPRVTPLGRFLRSTSLDELPQLINVLRGEMSLVGPRPHALVHNREYAKMLDGYLSRHRVKPGITGWAQVSGLRGETDTLEKMRARVEYDLYYIDHWSLWFDLKILVMTFFCGFINRNAY